MPKPTINISTIGQKPVTGQTSSRIDAQADATQYRVQGIFHVEYSLVLQYQKWQTGETDIVCVEAIGSNLLNTVIGRMRLSIYDHSDNKQWSVLKTAQLKNQSPPHANLFMSSANYYHELLGFSLDDFLNQQAPCKVGTKEYLLNETGRSKNTLAIAYNKKDVNIPLAAFVVSRVFPILTSV